MKMRSLISCLSAVFICIPASAIVQNAQSQQPSLSHAEVDSIVRKFQSSYADTFDRRDPKGMAALFTDARIISISLDELAAAKIRFHIMPGAHQHDPIVPSGQLEIATDEVRARATLDVIGYLAQQGLVIGSSKASAGSRMGLKILGPRKRPSRYS